MVARHLVRTISLSTAAAVVAAGLLAIAPTAAHADGDTEIPCPSTGDPTWSLDVGPVEPATAPRFDIKREFGPHWSVVGVAGVWTNIDLTLNGSPANTCNYVGFSDRPLRREVDWVAVDDLRTATGDNVASTNPTDWKFGYRAQYARGSNELSTNLPQTPQTFVGGGVNWMVAVRSIRLEKETTYAFTTSGLVSRMYLLAGTDDPDTWVRTDQSAELLDEGSDVPLTGLIRVPTEGNYGLLLVKDTNAYDDRPVRVLVEAIPDGPNHPL